MNVLIRNKMLRYVIEIWKSEFELIMFYLRYGNTKITDDRDINLNEVDLKYLNV